MQKLSLFSAILINANIMLGAGIFINTVLLAQNAGSLGALVYILVGILLLPLILSFSHLVALFKGGTFYDYGASLHPMVGVLNSWGYFVAKLASCSLGIHVFVTMMQQLFPILAPYNPLLIDTLIVAIFGYFIQRGLKTGMILQYSFMALKLIPLFFVIILAALLCWNNGFYTQPALPGGLISTIPFVLFAFAGFEATCSISQKIDNPEKNGPRAILISYITVITLVTLFQAGFFGLLGTQLQACLDYKTAYPTLINRFFNTIHQKTLLNAFMTAGIAASSLGAAFSIMFSNMWNLYILGQKKIFPFWRLITHNNNYAMPVWCIIIESIIIIGYIFLFRGNQVPNQQISACGAVLAYTISIIAYAKHKNSKKLYAYSALGSCVLLSIAAFSNALQFGITAYILYGVLIAIGLILSQLKHQKRQQA